MTDRELLEGFENCTLPNEVFHHEEHVRVAFLYLSRYPAREAFERFSKALVKFATAHGKAHIYSETLTLLFLLIIRDRTNGAGREMSWAEFKASNEDLFDRKKILQAYCRERACLGCWDAFAALLPAGTLECS